MGIRVERLTAEQLEAQVQMVVRGEQEGAHTLAALQGAIWAMIGPEGPQLARLATRQPGDFYIDDRVGGLRYPRTAIVQAVKVYEASCQRLGVDPADLQGVERLPHLGVW